MSPRVGVTLSGRYRLQRLIATGGMGQVWEGVDSRLGRRVAVKVLKAEYSTDPEFVERFRAEARTVAMLNHPGIASVYDYGETEMDGEGRTAYLVMELVNGEPLNSVLKRTGRLSLRHALDMLEQTGRALQIAHTAGLVHRDVKPGNILITPTGQVKLTDFGIAKAVDAAPVTQTGMVMGTAQYIAPEQALGHDDAAAAYSYAAPAIRQLFPEADIFMLMVQNSYAPIYRHKSFEFGEARAADGKIAQRVHIVDANGGAWEALYTLETQPDGSLKIPGCSLLKAGQAV